MANLNDTIVNGNLNVTEDVQIGDISVSQKFNDIDTNINALTAAADKMFVLNIAGSTTGGYLQVTDERITRTTVVMAQQIYASGQLKCYGIIAHTPGNNTITLFFYNHNAEPAPDNTQFTVRLLCFNP